MICSICLENDNKKIVNLACGHSFHYKCLCRIRKPECPLCRTFLSDIDVTLFEKIQKLQNDDKERLSLENELVACLAQLEEYTNMIQTITIKKQVVQGLKSSNIE